MFSYMASAKGTTLQPAYRDGLLQKRRNSIANALVLRLSCTNPSICVTLILYTAFLKNYAHIISMG